MRPGQTRLAAEPADESGRRNLNCPNCRSPWHVDAAACGSCGWRLPAANASSAPCPQCHQSKDVDSLSGRCTRCYPIKINDIDPELQAYAGSSRSQQYKEFAVGMLIGPAAIAICAYYSKGSLSTPLLISLVLTPIFIGASVYSLSRTGKSLLRYFRLGFAMRYGRPVHAELRFEVRGGGRRTSSTNYFNLLQPGPDSLWPSGLGKKIRVEPPQNEDAQVVSSKDKWGKFFKGFDPFERPAVWAKIYFDPDESGSAVIRIADSIFVSVTDNRPPADIF